MSNRTKNEILVDLDILADMMITNRSQADVEELLELLRLKYADMTPDQKTAVNTPSKGAYNYTDLDRVSNYCHDLEEVMRRFYGTNTPSWNDDLPEDWSPSNGYRDLSSSELNLYISDVIAIRNKWYADLVSTDVLPIDQISHGITFDTANNIEKTLLAIHHAINTFIFSHDDRYCGQLYGGDSDSIITCGMSVQDNPGQPGSGQYGIWMAYDRGGT